MRTWHPVQEDFLIVLNIIYLSVTLETFLKDIVFAVLRCSVLFWFQKISSIALLSNQLFLVFVVFSVPCLGLLCHFLSFVVLVVSLYLILFSLLSSGILYIVCFFSSLWVVECNGCLFSCGFWLIVWSSFPCTYIFASVCFPLASPQRPFFWLACLFDLCYASLYLV